jgi:hypothetical protein
MRKGALFLSLLVILALIGDTVPAAARGLSGDASTGTARVHCIPIFAVPAVITQAGVYCLVGNLSTDMDNGSAIHIASSNVTLEFNGFVLDGLGADQATTGTVGVFGVGQNITVRNGTVRGFYQGIALTALGDAHGQIVEYMRVDRNTAVGILVGGTASIVRRNVVVSTGGSGFSGPNTNAYGILTTAALGPRVLDNDVAGVVKQGTGQAVGIFLSGTEGGLVVNNRVTGADMGVVFSQGLGFSHGKYRDNLTFFVNTPYVGGTDAGNNN